MTLHVTRSERAAHTRLLRDHKANLLKHIPMTKRKRIEEAIEAHLTQADRLIGTLDEIDGDSDFEPSLGISQDGAWDDREMDVGDEGEAGVDDDLSCEDILASTAHPEAV